MAKAPRFWYDECPELLDRDRQILESLGFTLDERSLKMEQVVKFTGRSRYDPGRELVITYPEGYPSFPPGVISPVKDPSRTLARHHDPQTETLCCFGFNNSEWHAGMDALDVVLAAEELIRLYQPGSSIPDDDVVPEPRIAHYNYAPGSAILIPAPFCDLPLAELRTFQLVQIRLRRGRRTTRGVLSHLRRGTVWVAAQPSFQQWAPSVSRGEARNALLRVLPAPPPLRMDFPQLRAWLTELNINATPHQETWVLMIFPDEWGDRLRIRPTWIALRLRMGKAEWVRCHAASRDDIEVRTPHGAQLGSRHVLIVGCGSLGSAVAVNLAQEGIGTFTLVDADNYEPGNAVRHQVGIDHFGEPKVLAVSQRMRELNPSVEITPLEALVGAMRSAHNRNAFKEALELADIVVDTTGSQSVAHYLNDRCTAFGKPLVVGSVTNGVWSAEVFRYRPGLSGCRVCWGLTFADRSPPSAPLDHRRFAPGCNQPTFVGGAADVAVAAGLTARMVTECLTATTHTSQDYLVWINRESEGSWAPRVESFAVRPDPRCHRCHTDKGSPFGERPAVYPAGDSAVAPR